MGFKAIHERSKKFEFVASFFVTVISVSVLWPTHFAKLVDECFILFRH